MTRPFETMEKFAVLCAQGARQFGDDPAAIATYIEGEIRRLPEPERRELRQTLSLIISKADIRSQ
ncbi:hypothetical protein EPK99_23690 [Neorhizobium lilium]|uniref:Uncharacterized protein n=1 Tax=Neorhizobium lilium TaxID=2503024 RepID=A0A3S3S9S1_9HYPH|nr:hypothetical protein EPK99_23690 [Neorhizobium lilium]